MTKTQSYKDLIVYQKAYKLTLDKYRITKKFPPEELYGMISQMRRSAVSIPSNIAEGYRRGHRKEYVQFLHVAMGSCAELETQMSIAKDLCWISDEDFNGLYKSQDEVSRLLRKVIHSMTRPNERSQS
jgi:four helix bundle protein